MINPLAQVPFPVIGPAGLVAPIRRSKRGRKEYLERLTDHYCDKFANEQDRVTPNRRITNVLKEIWDTSERCELIMVFEETGPTNFVSIETLTRHPIPPDIHRIRVWYYERVALLLGLQLFDFKGKKVYESAHRWPFEHR